MLPLLTKDTIQENTKTCTDTAPRTAIQDQKLFNEIWIHVSRHTTINTDGEEETRKYSMGRGPWVTNTCYSCLEL